MNRFVSMILKRNKFMHKANKEIKTTDLVNVINPIISINTTEAKTDKSFLEFDKAKGDINNPSFNGRANNPKFPSSLSKITRCPRSPTEKPVL